MSSNNECYQLPSHDSIMIMLKALNDEFDDYLQYGLGYKKEQYVICGLSVLETIVRTDKRVAYFRYFHNMRINDAKKAALLAYWIIKFRPVEFVDKKLRESKEHANVNEKLAVNHLLCALVARNRVKLWDGHEGVLLDENNKFIKELFYSFRYRNFTIDSMIVLADSITTESFISPTKISGSDNS